MSGNDNRPSDTAGALCAEAGVSKPTAIKWLGDRREAQIRYQAGRRIADSNRARAAQAKESDDAK